MGSDVGQSLDQRRASHAWDAIQRVKKNAESVGSSDARSHVQDGGDRVHEKKNAEPPGPSYLREAKQLPVRILTAGLGHALAFLCAKGIGGNANDLLLRDIADWVLDKRDRPHSAAERPPPNALMEKIVKNDGNFLRIATDEVLAYLQWLTRFAEAELKDEQN